MGINVFSQSGTIKSPERSLDSMVLQFKMQDDAVNFIYACLDTFLANPSEKRLLVLDLCERLIWRPLKTDDEYIALVILQCNKGYYSSRFGDINKAVDAYESAWKIHNDHSLSGFDIIEYCLKPLGNNYSILGDYQSAANVIKNYLFIAEKENNFSHLTSAFINLSIVYHDTGRQAEAIELLKEALDIKGVQEFRKGMICSNLARNFLDLEQLAESRNYASQAMAYFQRSNSREVSVQLVNTLKILSLLSLQEGDHRKALGFIVKAKSIVSKNTALFKKRDLAKLMTEYAGIQALQSHNDVAIQNYQQALMLLLPGYKSNDNNDLPDKSLFYPENAIKETLDGLAGLYSKNDPLKALACFELSFVVEDLLRQTYHYQEDKLQQQIEIRNRTEQSLALLFDMFHKTKNQQFVQQAFQLAERTKSVVLKEAIDIKTRNQFIKQDSLLEKEHDLTFKKATFATDLVLEQMKGEVANVDQINELILRQTELSIEIKSVQKLISQKYPQYSAFANAKPIDINKLQGKLAREEATLVEYVAGKSTVYAFIVDAQSISFHKIMDGGKVYDDIRILNDLFSSPSRINNDIGLYKRIAYELNNLLRIPTATTIKNLLIVPDGLLNYVPFEALLSQENSAMNYAGLPYLIKKFTIIYGSSATSFADYKRSTPSKNSDVLAMFPIFKNNARMLAHSETEARSIQPYIKGKFLFEDKATKKAFGENLHRYSIIHLSTHANGGSWLEPPSIDFIDSTLYLPEIYGLQLHADLMVLSACETGVGKILKGEGALSLARGFQYAGANNIIFSLWKVNDNATAMLMSSFYKYYYDQEQISEALRLSKLNYLENEEISNSNKSPYFWAPFVYYGDIGNDTLLQESGIPWFKILLVVLVFVFLLIIFIGARKRQIVLKK